MVFMACLKSSREKSKVESNFSAELTVLTRPDTATDRPFYVCQNRSYGAV